MTQESPRSHVLPGAIVHCEQLSVRSGGPITLVRLAGEVDLGNAAAVGAQLEQTVLDVPRPTVIDLSGLEYLDLMGIRMLARTADRLREAGVESCVVLPPSTTPGRLLTLLPEPVGFRWRESLAAAIRSVTPG